MSLAALHRAARQIHSPFAFFATECIIRDCPLGGSTSLRSVWRLYCGHFGPCFVTDSGANRILISDQTDSQLASP